MVLLDPGYYEPARDWLRVRRLIVSAKDGSKIPQEDRAYVVRDVPLYFSPEWLVLYKDEQGKIFFKKSELEKWSEAKTRFAEYFTR